jgi:hypothetical protein
MMVLMAFVVLVPSGTAIDDGLWDSTTPMIRMEMPEVGILGGAFTKVIIVDNPLDHDLTMIDILPPALTPHDPEEDLMWVVPPGHTTFSFVVIVDTYGPVTHWETNTVEIYDGDTLVAWEDLDILIPHYDGFIKNAVLLSDSIELNTELNWLFEITVANTESWIWDGMYNIVVTDSFGPEFEIHDSNLLTPEFDPYELTHGTFDYTTNGNTEITWTIGDLAEGEEATLVLEVSTDGFTSPGRYQLNSGATLTFDRYIPCTIYRQVMALSAEIQVNAPGDWDLRTIGFWKHQFNCALGNKKKAHQHIPNDSLQAYLTEMSTTSTVPQLQTTDTFEEALEILLTKNNADMYDKAVTQLLATWMNYLSGNDMWDSDGDGETDTEIMETILWAEAGLLDLDPDNDEEIKDILDMLNNSGEE